MNNKVKKIVISTIKELNEELESEELIDISDSTRLYGTNGVLDSLSLVSLIADLEEKISEDFERDIVLADEKAMSQKTSPFRSVETLVNYIQQLLEE